MMNASDAQKRFAEIQDEYAELEIKKSKIQEEMYKIQLKQQELTTEMNVLLSEVAKQQRKSNQAGISLPSNFKVDLKNKNFGMN